MRVPVDLPLRGCSSWCLTEGRAFFGIRMTRNKLFRVFYIVMGLFLGYHFMMTSRSCQPNDCEYRGVRQYADGKTSLDGVRHLLEKIREETKSNSTRWKELSSGMEALDEVALQLMSLPTRTKWMKREVRPIKRSGGTFNITKSTAAVDICPEIYKGSTYGYPFFDKGFEMQPCSGVPKLQDILTLLFNFVHFDPSGDGKSKVDLDGILAQIYKLYPRIPVIIAISNTDDKFSSVKAKYTNVESIEFYTVYKMKPGAVWNTLVKKTNTKYTLIGRGLAYFDDDVRLERLIRELNSLFVDIIGGATRTPSGHWSQSCHQTVHKNYTLVYRTGYHHSKHGCILCGHLSGPFIARTSTLTKFPFNKIIQDANVLFDDFFLELKRQGRQSGACPDAMFHISEQESRKDRLQWLSTAGKWGINSVVLEDGTAMTFSCREIRRRCGLGAFTKGRLVPPCCLEGLARMIKTVMELCEKKNIYCEFQEGTLLGAVKFGKVLPWERDGDLTFWSANFSAMWDLRKVS